MAETDRESLWVGEKKTGNQYLYDPRISHPRDDESVLLYDFSLRQLISMKRANARAQLKAVTGPLRDRAVDSYVAAYLSRGDQFLQEYLDSIKQNDDRKAHLRESEEKRTKIVRRRHIKFLKERGCDFRGVSSTSGSASRNTHCYECKMSIDDKWFESCMACGWIICECGACGCGYKAGT